MRRCLSAYLLSLLAVTGGLAAQPLIGEAMPPIGDALAWHAGERVSEFEPDSVYLLDFWATWCPPCYPMIDHLSELQDRHRASGLRIIGIAVGTEVGTPLSLFLEQEGARISYSIAEPKDEEELKTALVHPSIMDPAVFALPFLMIVDRQGRLAWTSDARGADDDLDRILATILDGSFDLAAEAESRDLERALAEKAASDIEKLRNLGTEGRLEEAVQALGLLAEQRPSGLDSEAVRLLQRILCAEREDLVASYGGELLEKALGDHVNALVQAERSILALRAHDERGLAIAERMARRALELKGGDHPDFLFELAKVLAAQGRQAEAERLQRQAATRAREQGWQESYARYVGSVPLERALATQAATFAHICREEET